MDTLLFTLNAVLPAFCIVALGAFAGRMMPGLDPLPISRLAMYFMTPALIISTAAHASIPADNASRLAIAYLLFMVVLAVVCYLLVWKQPKKRRNGVVAASLFANTGNMGLSLSLFAYGIPGLERSVIIFVLSMLLMFSIGPALLSGNGGRFRQRLLEAWKLPPIWAAVVGLLLNTTNTDLPVVPDRVLELLGGAVVPTMLLLLGIQVARTWTWKLTAINWPAVLLKSAVAPALAVGVGLLLGLQGLDLAVLTLSAALPTAVNIFGVAVEVGGDYDDVGRTIFITTLTSAFTISATIVTFHQLVPIP